MQTKVIDKYLQRHEQFLEQIINKAIIPSERIRKALHYALFPGGKRIRPLITYLVGTLLCVPLNVLDVLAAAVELTHCYSLVHDDLPAMDNDDFRRGKLSCHKAFDEATAILVGDGLQAMTIEVLLTYLPPLMQDDQIIKITLALVQASGIGGMVSGQSLDLTELQQASVTQERLKTIHHLKTGKLLCACIEMVLAASSASEQEQVALKTYGNHIGLVFQMQDDYLDRYAPVHALGKGHSSDLANNKNTFATKMIQEELEHAIACHFNYAIDALALFKNKSEELLTFTYTLSKRSSINGQWIQGCDNSVPAS